MWFRLDGVVIMKYSLQNLFWIILAVILVSYSITYIQSDPASGSKVLWQAAGAAALAAILNLIPAVAGNFLSDMLKNLLRKKYIQYNEAAIKTYVKILSDKIDAATKEDANVKEEAKKVLIKRNELRDKLLALKNVLNSEFDLLSGKLKSGATDEEISHSLVSLNKSWLSDKEAIIEIEIRKLLVELGLIEA